MKKNKRSISVSVVLALSSGQDFPAEFLVVLVVGDGDVGHLGGVVPLPHVQDDGEVRMFLKLLGLLGSHGPALIFEGSLAGHAEGVVILRGPKEMLPSGYPILLLSHFKP